MAFDQGLGFTPAPGQFSSSASPSPPASPGVSVPPPNLNPPGATGGGIAMPDWGSIIANSPYVLAANALAAQQLAALKAQMGSSAARALINLGDIGLAGQVNGIELPSDTNTLVKQANTAGTSILSQLGHQHGLNEVAIPAQLAGRGFYRSGETGYQLGEENRHYGQQQYSARSSTLDYLNGLYSNYLNAQFGIQQGQLSAQMAAYQSALSQIGMLTGVGTTPNSGPPAGSKAVQGAPVSSYYPGGVGALIPQNYANFLSG